MRPVSDQLAAALERDRDFYNRAFETARSEFPRLTQDDVYDALTTRFAVVAEPLIRDHGADAADALRLTYRVMLRLLGQRLMGPHSRCAAIDRAWRGLLAQVPDWIVSEPERCVAEVSNLAWNVHRHGGDLSVWFAGMTRALESRRDLGNWLEMGVFQAWRSGLAYLRQPALDFASRFDARIVGEALGCDADDVASQIETLRHNPWAGAGDACEIVTRIGGFVGFGGGFAVPPRVVRRGAAFYAQCRQRSWRIYVDRFGQSLEPVAACPKGTTRRLKGQVALDADGTVTTAAGAAHKLSALAEATSWAADAHCLLVTLAHSHQILVVAAP